MRIHRMPPSKAPVERAFLVGATLPTVRREEELENLRELEALARAAGALIAGSTIQGRTRINGSTFIGSGKLEQLAEEIHDREANLVIFDDELSPAQARNIEKRLGVNVIDRSELILDIFARRARTKQAKIQVEIAQLRYALPRLRRLWDHLERQAGGIGTRGPGETQIEVDRRRAYDRISVLTKELERLQRGVEERRKRRRELFNVTIVGYTNAGKSTLLNRMAGSDVVESARLFSTLDSTTRRVRGPSGEIFLLTDTIGFIRKLPPHLIASFRATLMDVREADLLLHVVDVSRPRYRERIEIVNGVLDGIFEVQKPKLSLAQSERQENSKISREESAVTPAILIFNKIDLIDDEAKKKSLATSYPDAILASAFTGEGIGEIIRRIEARMAERFVRAEIRVHPEDGAAISEIKKKAKVLSSRIDDGVLVFEAIVKRRDISKLESCAKVSLRFLVGEGASNGRIF